MKIEISGQNLNTGQSFKNYAEEKLQKSTNKYFERAISGSIILKKSINEFTVKILVSLTKRARVETCLLYTSPSPRD